MKKQLSLFIALTVFCAIILFALPSIAIEPPSDRDAERLRNAPDLQERIDRANALLAPLLNAENIQLTDFSATFSKGLNESFGTKEGESGFVDRLDTNADKIIDERDFIELSFLVPQIHRQACSSPKTGEAKCIVLPLKFPDVAPSPSHHSGYWDNMFFGGGTYTTHSYFQQVSAGKLDMGGNVLVDPAQPDGYWMADYPKTTYNDETLLEEILDKADPIYDFSEYDADHNGEADGVFFIYAGETDGWGDFYWGWATYGPWIVDGVRVGPLMFVGENLMTYRVAAHEFGHMMGLPDYYDYTFNSNGVGVWCLMGKGESYMSAKARAYLGWVDPIAISMDTYGVPFMTPRSENGNVWRLWTQGDYGPQYFLLEGVKPTGYDYQLPGEGLLVWHVDETVGNNNNWHHKHLDLEEADGLDDIDTKANNGDTTDPYYSPNQDTFNHSTYPNSDAYSGAETLIQVLNVSELSTLAADLLIGVPGNLEVDEIEPNNVWNDSGVIAVKPPNSKPDGKVDVYSDLSDYWRVTVAKPSVIDVSLDSYLDGVDLSLYLWSLGGGGPIEVADTTRADEHIRAYVYVPGNHYIEVRAKRQGTYYDLRVKMEYLPDPGEIEIKSVPLFGDTIYDNTMTIPAMRIDILDNAGDINLNSLQLYTQGDYPSIIQNVSLWLDNGDEIFSPGDDSLVGGPVTVGPSN
ncbi:MAG: M6 family metalloprotease domain-containing protein, partial [bacterium]